MLIQLKTIMMIIIILIMIIIRIIYGILHGQMRDKIDKENIRRARKVLMINTQDVNHLHRHDKNNGLEETRIPWFRLWEKKFAGNELRLSYTGLCDTLLCTRGC